ncbi:MAG TPA: EAL domain-containing protein [Terracidiphilus sp.]|jgi:sensor c-di-GMP phosphodiesterase-like protein|nr:EAL domain-containing protein [Terracidiphilus sp.]
MQEHRKNEESARAIVAAMAALGMVAGFALGILLAIPFAELHLKSYLGHVDVQERAAAKEARDVLNGLNQSTSAACSETELAALRALVFRSGYVKDAGRMRGGKIICSATAGRPAHAPALDESGVMQADGTVGYANLLPVPAAGLQRGGLQRGNAYVVLGPEQPVVEGRLPIHLAVSREEGVRLKSDAGSPGDRLTRDGDTLVARHCSAVVPTCVTATVSVNEARQGEIVEEACAAGLGCVAGALAGMLLCAFRRHRLSMEQQLRKAIATDKLQVVYQPIVNLVDGKIIGAEALARWKDRDGKAVSPDLFIKVAEQHGFVGSLTSLVFRRALKEFREVLTKIPDFKLDINVTAADLADPAFLPMLEGAVKENKVAPGSVVIEVTESSTANQEVAMESLRLLRRMGHSIYIDDFGTGYSSLSYLLYLSIDRIKIDKAFTRAIGTGAPTQAILPQIMAMARSLNLGVVVEGVETEQQSLYFTVNDQTIHGQGYLFGEPMTAEAFLELMAPKLARAANETEQERTREAVVAASLA